MSRVSDDFVRHVVARTVTRQVEVGWRAFRAMVAENIVAGHDHRRQVVNQRARKAWRRAWRKQIWGAYR